jgi:hypothetical protein
MKSPDALEHLLRPKDAGLLLGLTSVRVRQLADEGRIPCVRTRLGRLFHIRDVERFAAERKRAYSRVP